MIELAFVVVVAFVVVTLFAILVGLLMEVLDE